MILCADSSVQDRILEKYLYGNIHIILMRDMFKVIPLMLKHPNGHLNLLLSTIDKYGEDTEIIERAPHYAHLQVGVDTLLAADLATGTPALIQARKFKGDFRFYSAIDRTQLQDYPIPEDLTNIVFLDGSETRVYLNDNQVIEEGVKKRVPEIISEKHIKSCFSYQHICFIIASLPFLPRHAGYFLPTDTTVFALITGCLLILAVRPTPTHKHSFNNPACRDFYVRLFTCWYINEIPDHHLQLHRWGRIVKGYWTFTMLPLIPVVYMIFRGASAALEERSLPDRLIDIFPQLTKPGEEDLVICKTLSGKDVVIPANDRYLNTLIGGSIGTGKTSRLLAPIIYQELQAIKRSMGKGIPRGLTVLEPKGDLTDKAAEMCEDLGVPYVYINPLRDDTARFNPLEGDPMLVAEATRTVLSSIGGKQEAFFALNEIAARNTILLLKYTKGNNLSLPDVSKALRVPTH